LQRALEAIVKGMSVYRAARQYNVPESTLRDRTRGNVDIEAKISQDVIQSVNMVPTVFFFFRLLIAYFMFTCLSPYI
jgi:hypothetical protein